MSGPVDPGEKGILHPREQSRHRTLERRPPGPAVGRFVDWYWIVHWDLRGRPAYRAEVLSFPCVNLTFERSATRTGAFVTGVTTTKYVRELTGVGSTFGVRFRAGGFGACTGIEVGALRDRSVPMREVFPDAGDLPEAVLTAASDEERQAMVEDWLARRAGTDDPVYRLVLRIVDAMEHDRTLTRVDQVTDRFGVPVRTLQRMFRRYVGAGPKWVLRRYRLQDGADLLAQGRVADLATLAVELGYFDQAHFSREFTAEIGMTPSEYARHSAALAGDSVGAPGR
ncbi:MULTISPECIES: helix-turn-helix domain-containing protein [Nocardia]|uniref:helix-turn-helix domain-containing protein n=1 Tax=Nocardia TaxID=1817 RepID=UPI000BF1DD1F|nr:MULTISPECIES: helix-turn-helix transcriptional regulator [Nocardia]MBF6188099.1 helix-turn-helix transcriptional regulator [Nocardia farcinica]MBF6248849.1 helix-turn-helix transcriptional regulator [Nocardia elegans]MBF6314582.1 helix-turn-helix transcriptional regulator [Nocardia farcinica]MBF6363647.1 helix-turn-helix transcriptional regulator [Nocardia farcinica]MBF6409985.1 helix-turn-helix transcriptional regulator [Nocardia farcinica]